MQPRTMLSFVLTILLGVCVGVLLNGCGYKDTNKKLVLGPGIIRQVSYHYDAPTTFVYEANKIVERIQLCDQLQVNGAKPAPIWYPMDFSRLELEQYNEADGYGICFVVTKIER